MNENQLFVQTLLALAPKGTTPLMTRGKPHPGHALPLIWLNDTFPTFINIAASDAEHVFARVENFGAGLALGLDDICQKGGIPGLRPTAIIETHPGSFHYWYFLRSPITNAARFRELVRAATALYGDKASSGAMRWLRYPGHNHPGRNFVSRIIRFTPNLRFTHAELVRDLDLTIQPVRKPVPPSPLTIADRPACSEFEHIAALCTEKTPYGNGYRVDCPWQHLHTAADRGANAMITRPSAEYHYPGYSCFHGGCKGKSWSDFVAAKTIFAPALEQEKRSVGR